MRIIDTHCHYNLEPLFSGSMDESSEKVVEIGKWRQHWQKAQEAGVVASVVIGTNVMTSYRAVQLCREDKNLYPAVSLHPTEVTEKIVMAQLESRSTEAEIDEMITNEINKIEYLASQSEVIAIGECGLDYFRLPQQKELVDTVKQYQQQVFRELIEIGLEKNLPIICHIRDKDETAQNGTAYWEALEILQQMKVKKFVLHCVSGPAEYVEAAIKLGAYVGFDGNITYPKADHLRSLFSLTPVDRRLVETDAPYLPPQEFRGQTCEPWMIAKTVEFIENSLDTSSESLLKNSQQFFQLT